MDENNRLAGSIFSEVTESKYENTPDIEDTKKFNNLFTSIQGLVKDQQILSMHDISDGGLITSLLEMCFTKKAGMTLNLDSVSDINSFLFSEEIGFVIQVKDDDKTEVISILKKDDFFVKEIAKITDKDFLIVNNERNIFKESIIKLEKIWRETSHAIQALRDNKEIADAELSLLEDKDHIGLQSNASFDESQLKLSLIHI